MRSYAMLIVSPQKSTESERNSNRMNVNYLTEIRQFSIYAARVSLPASAQLLWYKLIEIMNQSAHGTQWRDGFLRIDNAYLLTYFPMSHTSLAAARRILCDYGLLEYLPGEKKRIAPAYRLRFFSTPDGDAAIHAAFQRQMCTDSAGNSASDIISGGENDAQPVDNSRSNATHSVADSASHGAANAPFAAPTAAADSSTATDWRTDSPSDSAAHWASSAPKSRDIYPNKTETETGTETRGTKNTSGFLWEGAGARAHTHAGASAREDAEALQIARSAFRVALHMPCTDAQLQPLMAAYRQYRPDRGVLIQAIVRAGEAKQPNPASYAATLLTDWGKAGVRRVSELA